RRTLSIIRRWSMVHSPLRLHPLGHVRLLPLLFAVLLITFGASPARAQMGGVDSDPGDPGTGGRNTFQGSIFLPGGRRMDRRGEIKLVGKLGGGGVRKSGGRGGCRFKRLPSGRYNLVGEA